MRDKSRPRAASSGLAGRRPASGKRSARYSTMVSDSGSTVPSSSTRDGTLPIGLTALYSGDFRPPGGSWISTGRALA